MPLGRKTREKKLRRALLAALLAAAFLANAVPAFAAEDVGTDYIVKYK